MLMKVVLSFLSFLSCFHRDVPEEALGNELITCFSWHEGGGGGSGGAKLLDKLATSLLPML